MSTAQTVVAQDIVAEVSRLERQVSEHKREIGQRRRKLHAAMTELAQLRRRCQELGIGVVLVSRDASH